MKTKIVNRNNASFDISVGRDSKWGNPFRMLKQTIEELPNYQVISNGKKINQGNLSISACSPNYGYYEAKDKKKSERENKEFRMKRRKNANNFKRSKTMKNAGIACSMLFKLNYGN